MNLCAASTGKPSRTPYEYERYNANIRHDDDRVLRVTYCTDGGAFYYLHDCPDDVDTSRVFILYALYVAVGRAENYVCVCDVKWKYVFRSYYLFTGRL